MQEFFNQAIKTLSEWVEIKSVKSTPSEGAPFGLEIKKMLQKALLDASSLGFEVKNYDGYIGEVIYGNGDDSEGLAILCHLDVVPEGDLKRFLCPSCRPFSAIITP